MRRGAAGCGDGVDRAAPRPARVVAGAAPALDPGGGDVRAAARRTERAAAVGGRRARRGARGGAGAWALRARGAARAVPRRARGARCVGRALTAGRARPAHRHRRAQGVGGGAGGGRGRALLRARRPARAAAARPGRRDRRAGGAAHGVRGVHRAHRAGAHRAAQAGGPAVGPYQLPGRAAHPGAAGRARPAGELRPLGGARAVGRGGRGDRRGHRALGLEGRGGRAGGGARRGVCGRRPRRARLGAGAARARGRGGGAVRGRPAPPGGGLPAPGQRARLLDGPAHGPLPARPGPVRAPSAHRRRAQQLLGGVEPADRGGHRAAQLRARLPRRAGRARPGACGLARRRPARGIVARACHGE